MENLVRKYPQMRNWVWWACLLGDMIIRTIFLATTVFFVHLMIATFAQNPLSLALALLILAIIINGALWWVGWKIWLCTQYLYNLEG